MYISKVKIQKFRAFQKKCEFRLNKNVNVITGLNGTGKSTLLAILTNVGELTKINDQKIYLLNNEKFRGDFSDVIMYDKKHDSTGKKVEIYFSDLPQNADKYNVSEKITFNAHTQQATKSKGRGKGKIKYTRYRLIPTKTREHNNNKKVTWPSYYLGLSRLTPLGEATNVNRKNKVDNEYKQKIFKTHNQILNEKLDFQNVEISNLDISSNHPKSTISTKEYGDAANSNGQDNTGQIIEAIYSFEKLKEEYPDDYIGGIIAIDEIDASLHPSAQNKLIDWLIKKSEELNLQMVLTTHSLSAIKHIFDISNTNSLVTLFNIEKTNNDLIVRNCNDLNLNFNFYIHNLMETYTAIRTQQDIINVLTEDQVARWFLKRMISQYKFDYDSLSNIKLLEINISWSHLLNLLNSSKDTFNKFICILDGDVKDSDIKEYKLDHTAFDLYYDENNKIQNNTNILRLPCNDATERILYKYANSLEKDHPLFLNDDMLNNGMTSPDKIHQIAIDTQREYKGKHSDTIKNTPYQDITDINFCKAWYERNTIYMNKILDYWIKDNESDVKKFLGHLNGLIKKRLL